MAPGARLLATDGRVASVFCWGRFSSLGGKPVRREGEESCGDSGATLRRVSHTCDILDKRVWRWNAVVSRSQLLKY